MVVFTNKKIGNDENKTNNHNRYLYVCRRNGVLISVC